MGKCDTDSAIKTRIRSMKSKLVRLRKTERLLRQEKAVTLQLIEVSEKVRHLKDNRFRE